jgi:hypothetical protein
MDDPVGEIAHIITGEIGRVCCHKTGGFNNDPKCECRGIAETLIEFRDRVQEALNAVVSP